MIPTRGRDSSPLGSLLVLVGCLAVLGATFGAGFVTGRHWSHRDSLARWTKPEGAPHSGREDAAGTRAGSARSTEKVTSPPLPALTFYHDLTAPLAAPPPKVPKTEPPKASAVEPPPTPKAEAVELKPDAVEAAGPPQSPVFTVQVAAYSNRLQAEALRETLAARGIDAEVTEAVTLGGTRYRVRVGSYPTKAAALEAATRVAADTRLQTFVAPH